MRDHSLKKDTSSNEKIQLLRLLLYIYAKIRCDSRVRICTNIYESKKHIKTNNLLPVERIVE
jgi:hypothetical protein